MSFIPRPHEIYKHFKGNLYQITAVAVHTETGERLVIYQAMYGDFQTYARPLEMFTGRVDREKYPQVSQEFRFELQGPGAERQRAESDPTPEASNRVSGEASAAPEAANRVSGEVSPTPEAVGTDRGAFAASDSGGEDRSQGELALDPMVLQFLDADEYELRLNILAGLHHRITDEMITTMAIACGVEIDEGDTEERYEALKKCLLTLERYEGGNRIR